MVSVCVLFLEANTTQLFMKATLRRYAEYTMQSIVRQVFHRLSSLDPVAEEEKLDKSDDEPQDHEIKVNMQSLNDEVRQISVESHSHNQHIDQEIDRKLVSDPTGEKTDVIVEQPDHPTVPEPSTIEEVQKAECES